jgi:hypothetical protein
MVLLKNIVFFVVFFAFIFNDSFSQTPLRADDSSFDFISRLDRIFNDNGSVTSQSFQGIFKKGFFSRKRQCSFSLRETQFRGLRRFTFFLFVEMRDRAYTRRNIVNEDPRSVFEYEEQIVELSDDVIHVKTLAGGNDGLVYTWKVSLDQNGKPSFVDFKYTIESSNSSPRLMKHLWCDIKS